MMSILITPNPLMTEARGLSYCNTNIRNCKQVMLISLGELGWTNGWRFQLAISSNHAPTIKKLHEQYGPIVRTGLNMLDLNFPSLVRTVYNTNGQWLKVSCP